MFREKELFVDLPHDRELVKKFLEQLNLKLPVDIDYVVGIYYGEKLIGTGSLVGDIIQGVGVDPRFRGEGVSSLIVSHLIKKAVEMGKRELFVFTKPGEVCRFKDLGFRLIAQAEPFAALLEWGQTGIEEYKEQLKKISENTPGEAACIVVNCNPFTLGHRYLIEQAARENSRLYILVVEEDRSLFPFSVRLDLIKQGTQDLKNITIIPGGKYVISSLTFPSYFTREEKLVHAYALLDLKVFAAHIAPALRIKKRYVGEEPYCQVTALYNRYMQEVLPPQGIEVKEITRLKNKETVVSASLVRDLIRQGKMEQTRNLVPVSTYNYLQSPSAREVIKRIKMSSSRH